MTTLNSLLVAASQNFAATLGPVGITRRDAKRAARAALDAALPALTDARRAGETDDQIVEARIGEALEARFRVLGRVVREQGVEAAEQLAATTDAVEWISLSAGR